MIGSVTIYYQLTAYEDTITKSNKEKFEKSIENLITRREGRIYTIADSLVAFYSSSQLVEPEEFANFSRIILGNNIEILNLFVLEDNKVIQSYPISEYLGNDFDYIFPTYPTVIDEKKAMTVETPINERLSLIVAVPFDYFVQDDTILSDNYKLVLFSPINNNETLYEFEKNGKQAKYPVTFTDNELKNSIEIEKQTDLYGHKIKDYYNLKYLLWDISFEQQSSDSLLILISGIVISIIIPILLIRTNLLRNQIQEKSENLQKVNQELKNVEKSKDEFVTMIVHDLKNPLVPIQAYTDILLSESHGKLTNEQIERLRYIKTNISTLQKMIQDLLDANKLELNRLKLDIQKSDLTEIINLVIAKLKPEFTKKGILVSVNLARGVFCTCDRMRIEQVLNNILLNALDFVSQNDGKIDVILTIDKKDAKIVIKDNGIGIPKDHLDKIFVKFYQLNVEKKREYGGSGLGLAVCSGIIESHGGKIWAESEGIGKGTQIHIRLPLLQPK